jgi:hypothetical protein
MNKNTQKVSQESIEFYLKKSEFWIGLGALLIVLILGGSFIYKKMSPTIAGKMQKKEVAIMVTKAPTLTQGASVMPTVVPSQQPTPTTSIKKVAQLANTSGDITEVVLKGDSFWKITRRVCGDGRYYRITQEYNGYSDHEKLHEGDVVTVICHE